MKVEVEIDESLIRQAIAEKIDARVNQLVWTVKDELIAKLIDKFTPEDLKLWKESSREAFEQGVKEKTMRFVEEYLDSNKRSWHFDDDRVADLKKDINKLIDERVHHG